MEQGKEGNSPVLNSSDDSGGNQGNRNLVRDHRGRFLTGDPEKKKIADEPLSVRQMLNDIKGNKAATDGVSDKKKMILNPKHTIFVVRHAKPPNEYAVDRKLIGEDGKEYLEADYITGESFNDIAKIMLGKGLTRQERMMGDNPKIVEYWI